MFLGTGTCWEPALKVFSDLNLPFSFSIFFYQNYLQPLKSPDNANLCDQAAIEVMFYKIPEILHNHQQFLEQLEDRMKHWHNEQKIGDIISQSVRTLLEHPDGMSWFIQSNVNIVDLWIK